jgi:hypothetical protein
MLLAQRKAVASLRAPSLTAFSHEIRRKNGVLVEISGFEGKDGGFGKSMGVGPGRRDVAGLRWPMIAVGDVLTLHDADTGASGKNRTRPCMVVAIGATVVIVAPRSVSVAGPVPTPISASPGFTKSGSFSRWRCRVGRVAADGAVNHGQLAEPYRSQVLVMSVRSSP